MSDLNSVSIVGRLTKDAESRKAGNSDLVTFGIANNTGFGQYACTNFFNVNAWGKQAMASLPYLTKGKQVALTGTMENRAWMDQQGVKRDCWTITVTGPINLMNSPKDGAPAPTEAPAPAYPPEAVF